MSDHSDSASSYESSRSEAVCLPTYNNHVNESHASTVGADSSVGEFAYLYTPSSQGTFGESSQNTETPVFHISLDEEESSQNTGQSKASKTIDTVSTLSTFRASLTSDEPASAEQHADDHVDEHVPEGGDVKVIFKAEVTPPNTVPQHGDFENVPLRNIATQHAAARNVGPQNIANARQNINEILRGYRRYFIGCSGFIGIVVAIIIIVVLCRQI